MNNQPSYSLAFNKWNRTLPHWNNTLVHAILPNERSNFWDNPVDVHFEVVLLEKFKDTNIKLLQIISYSKFTPASTESGNRAVIIVYIINFPRLSLWIPECHLLVFWGQRLSDKITRDILQNNAVSQQRSDGFNESVVKFLMLYYKFNDR
jgi:hypothetical protein